MTYSTMFGGHPDSIPRPWKMRYPGRRKRRVRVSISIYSVGKHYWVDIEEEDNPVWDEAGRGWRTFWNHPAELTGIRITQQCDSPYSAKVFVDEQLAQFPKSTHKVEWQYGKDYIRKQYIQHEGD